MSWDNELMFSDAQPMDGTAGITSLQSVDLAPLQDVLGRNVGVGVTCFVEVYGEVVTGALTGTLSVSLVTDADPTLGSTTTLFTRAGLAIPTATGQKAAIFKFQLPIFFDYERYIGIGYIPNTDWNNNLLITAGITLVPTQLRNYGSGMNFN